MKCQWGAIPKSPSSGGSMFWLAAVLIIWPFPEIGSFLCLLVWVIPMEGSVHPLPLQHTYTPMTSAEQCPTPSTSPINTGRTKDNNTNTVEPRFLNLFQRTVREAIFFKNRIILVFFAWEKHDWSIVQVSAWKGCQVENRDSFVRQPGHVFHKQLSWEPNCSRTKTFKNWGLTVLANIYWVPTVC